jgi:DNA primase large subunit
MRIFNETKTIELTIYDLEKGYLKDDKLFIKHHEAVAEVKEKGHYEKRASKHSEYPDIFWVVDTPRVRPQEAWDEYEDIQVYVPYTEEELAKIKQEKYENKVVELIRQKYSLNQELAILRQRDTKTSEFEEYNAYAEECKNVAKSEEGGAL